MPSEKRKIFTKNLIANYIIDAILIFLMIWDFKHFLIYVISMCIITVAFGTWEAINKYKIYNEKQSCQNQNKNKKKIQSKF